MEEVGEVHEEDKVSLENSKKRTLKTPSQVEALERLYNDHKYPTESMKSQLAEEIGLSEKQVSGWFCHRRLKDKNMLKDDTRVIGRQDFSSGVVQDRGSALKQDSCSSTKHGEHKQFDPREVESQRFCAQESPTEDLPCRNREQHMHYRNNIIMDNTSSGSTSASQERMSPRSKDPYEAGPLRYSSRSSDYALMTMKNLKPRGHAVGSEYMNSQDEIENAAILAVKRQLGRHYREDGPQLGVKFDSIPPSAFEAPIEEGTTGQYYAGESIVPKVVGVLKVHKEPTFDTRYSHSNHGLRPYTSYPEEDRKKIKLEPDHRNNCSSYQLLDHGTGRYSSVENIDDDPSGVTGVLNKSRKRGMKSMLGEGKKSKSLRNHFHGPLEIKAVTSRSYYPGIPDCDDSSSRMLQKRKYLKGSSQMIRKHDECFNTEGSEQFRTAKPYLKEKPPHKERRKSSKTANSVRVNMQLENEAGRKTKQSDDHLQLDYVLKTPSPRVLLPQDDQMKGFVGDIPTSFSDDEAMTSSSSMD